MKNSGGWEISRRYFVMNGFDGILTVLGITLSSYFLSISNPTVILATGFSASIAIGVSGFWIAFLTEEAEQKRTIDKLEEQMLVDLEGSVLTEASKVASIVNSFIDGFSPFFFGALSLSAFILVNLDFMSMDTGYLISFISSGILLFILGLFLGRISHQSLIIMGMKTTMAGIFVAILILLTGIE